MQSKSLGKLSQMVAKPVAYRRKSAAERRRDLIDAGIRCLGKGGMSGFTIDEICKQARVSRGLVNHHFQGKQDLLLKIYTDMTEHLVQEPSGQGSDEILKWIIDSNFDESSFNKSNLRAWLSIWGQVPTNPELNALHLQRYQVYKKRIENALLGIAGERKTDLDTDSIARQLIALIDGLWLEYCLHSEGFSLAAARTDCYRMLNSYGIEIN